MFVSALYAVVDPTGHDMTFVNAGHHPPLIWRPRLSGTRSINLKGAVLGLLDTERARIHPHAFRHYAATAMKQSGIDLDELKEMLGHADLATTSIYLHVCAPHLQAAVALHPLGG